MNSNLLHKDLKRNLKSFLGGTFSVVAFIGITIGVYSTMIDSMDMISNLYSTLPDTIMEALNFREGQWNTMLGFYATYFVYYIPIMGGIYAYYLGSRILAVEEQYRTAEFLISRPLSRGSIIFTRLVICFIYVVGFNITVYITGLISCGLASGWEYSILNFTILHLYGLTFCLFIGFLGFFISVFMKKAKSSLMAGIGIIMGSYLFDMIIRITDKVQFLAYLTPFKYMNMDAISPGYGLEAWRVLILFGLSGILIFLSFAGYRRKDILI
jgi:ABC-2 type transport system permease protein